MVERDGRLVWAPEDAPVLGPPRTSFDTTVGGAAWVAAEGAAVSAASAAPEPGSPGWENTASERKLGKWLGDEWKISSQDLDI